MSLTVLFCMLVQMTCLKTACTSRIMHLLSKMHPSLFFSQPSCSIIVRFSGLLRLVRGRPSSLPPYGFRCCTTRERQSEARTPLSCAAKPEPKLHCILKLHSVILISVVFNLGSRECSPLCYFCLWVETESTAKWGPCSNQKKLYKSHKWFLWIILQYLVTHPPDITM